MHASTCDCRHHKHLETCCIHHTTCSIKTKTKFKLTCCTANLFNADMNKCHQRCCEVVSLPMPAEALLLAPIKVPGSGCKQPLNAEAVPEPIKMPGHDDLSNNMKDSVLLCQGLHQFHIPGWGRCVNSAVQTPCHAFHYDQNSMKSASSWQQKDAQAPRN